MEEIEVFEGEVTAVYQDTPEKYAVYVDKQRLSGWGECPVQMGQHVRVGAARNGRYLDIRWVEATAGAAVPSRSNDQEEMTARRIARCVALKVATGFDDVGDVESAKRAAQVLERFILFED